jgi:hypothetical protein
MGGLTSLYYCTVHKFVDDKEHFAIESDVTESDRVLRYCLEALKGKESPQKPQDTRFLGRD